MRSMLETFNNTLSVQAASMCGAEYGPRSPERSNRRQRVPTGACADRAARQMSGAEHRVLLLHLRVHVLLCRAVHDCLKDSFGDVVGRVG